MGVADWNDIAVFTEVVRSGSFTAAAGRLGMPKSTVSRKVSRLEERLGARLLHRTTRKLGLTEVGAVYFGRCEQALAQLEEAEQAVAESQASPRGVLRVTAPPDFGEAYMGELAGAYVRAFPETQVELVLTERLVDLVAEGFDVAIRAGPLRDSALVARQLGAARVVVCASPAYLERAGTPEQPDELRSHDCILFSTDARRRATWALTPHRGAAVEVPVSGPVAANNYLLVHRAALADLGVAMMPAFVCARDIASGRLVRLFRSWRAPEAPLHALYPSTRHLSAKVRAFLDLMREVFSPPPWAVDP